MGLLGMFKKKAKVAQRDIGNFAKKDLMEATVGIAVLVMYADGSAEDAERAKIQKILDNTPALKNFGAQVQEAFVRFDTLCRDAGMIMARSQIMREIKDCQGDAREMEDVLVTGLTIALADGEMSEPEEKVLKEVASAFGLRLETYLG